MAVITPLVAYFSMILTELRRYRRNYGRKNFYNIFHSYHETPIFSQFENFIEDVLGPM